MNKAAKLEMVKAITDRMSNQIAHHPSNPRVNAYICNCCAHITFVVDVADGTTPMTLQCMRPVPKVEQSVIIGAPVKEQPKRCDGMMASAFYSLVPDDYDMSQVTHEWHAPKIEEYLAIRGRNRAVAAHIAKGGLLLRKRTAAPILTHGEYLIDSTTMQPLTPEQAEANQTEFERMREQVRIDEEKLRHAEHGKRMADDKRKARQRKKRRR